MTGNPKPPLRPFFLGFEGGGTHGVAFFSDARGTPLGRVETDPANLRLLDDRQLSALFRFIAARLPQPHALAIGMAGARSKADFKRILAAAEKIWPGIPCRATNDLETALATADNADGKSPVVSVLVLSGTGSCCYGRNAAGKTVKVGGWGHLLGDQGSGYDIALRALRAVVAAYDSDGAWPGLGRRILHRLQLNEPADLISWVQSADKSQIASLAVEVFAAWQKSDKIAAEIISNARNDLAQNAIACASQLASPKTPVHFIFAGGTLLKQSRFMRQVSAQIRKLRTGSIVSPLEHEGAWGAVALARNAWKARSPAHMANKRARVNPAAQIVAPEISLSDFGKSSPTERRNPRSRHLDKLSVASAIKLMLSEDSKVPNAILREHKNIERAVGFIVRAFKQGGPLFYIGAGTSGRLGVLDASECPPTFGAPPELVQGIIAGGQTALWRSVEGAEDDSLAGARALEFRGVTQKDVVVGITASGRTPFVWGALGEARRRGAKTVLISFNPLFQVPVRSRPSLIITPDVGPEILTGSTRLKAGTATKLILNIFTTLAMVRIGKVTGNLMTDLNPSNVKLRDRAVRIVQELRNVDYATAHRALENSRWVVKKACAKLRRKSA